VIDTLARGLVALGHEVSLFTVGESTCPVDRRWVYEHAVVPMGQATTECRHVQAAYDELLGYDVIHDHTTVGPVWAAALRRDVPVVTTVHCSFHEATRPVYARLGRWVTVNAISHSQRRSAPEVPVAAVIHHGVDPARYPVGAGDGGYAVFIGRCSPDKGAREAIEIARRAGLPLRIAAKMREPDEVDYFRRCIEPSLGPDVEFLGEVGPDERDRLLGGAVALLNPITWTEPFGLVMIEAMACGTPVIAFRSGAAPEIVTHGRTGFLCRDVGDAVHALRSVAELDRAACRAEVEGRFSARRMTRDYVSLYRDAADRRVGGYGAARRPRSAPRAVTPANHRP
jgi:glycosyltransferase involved in cell wall biosynthesis